MEVIFKPLTKENLQIIMKIDAEFYHNDQLTLSWYLERYNVKHQGLFLYNDKECVGYLVSVPIKKELYDAITNGVLINDIYINPEMFIDNSLYNYIISCVIKKEHRHQGYGALLLDTFLKQAKGYYCTMVITRDGYNLVKNKLELKNHILNDTYVFVKNKML